MSTNLATSMFLIQVRGWSISENLLSILVPLLALPQITHYILDGFIWKIRKDEFKWKSETVSTTGNTA